MPRASPVLGVSVARLKTDTLDPVVMQASRYLSRYSFLPAGQAATSSSSLPMRQAASSARAKTFPPHSADIEVAISRSSSGKSSFLWFTLMPMPMMTLSISPLSATTESSVRMPQILWLFIRGSFTHLISHVTPHTSETASLTATAVQAVTSLMISRPPLGIMR